MAGAAGLTEAVLYDTLVNYLVSMARTVEGAMTRALDAIVGLESSRAASLPGEVFLLEPRINEMEIVIDEHAIRLLRRGSFTDDEMRLIVAALKITNDLERIADHATNIAEDIIFWVRGLDVRHGRLPRPVPPAPAASLPGSFSEIRSGSDQASLTAQPEQTAASSPANSEIMENSHALHSDVTPNCQPERA